MREMAEWVSGLPFDGEDDYLEMPLYDMKIYPIVLFTDEVLSDFKYPTTQKTIRWIRKTNYLGMSIKLAKMTIDWKRCTFKVSCMRNGQLWFDGNGEKVKQGKS